MSSRRFELKKLMEGEGTIKSTILSGLAELLGTAILVFLGCMGCIGSFGPAPPHLQITINFGLAVMIVIQCFGHISHAHVNPAITFGAVVLGKKSIPEGLVYVISQTLGGVLGYGMLKIVTPGEHLTANTPDNADKFCVTDLHQDVMAIQGLMLEGLATTILMFIACAIWDRRNEKNTDSVAIKFGLAVTALATAFGPYTGCSMNPARSFAPALWNGQWAHHWIYWFGPIGGSIVSAFAYRAVFGLKAEADLASSPEAVALNSVDTQKPEQI